MILAWILVIFGIAYWILNKFVKFMTMGHVTLKDLIRAGLWSIIALFIWRKLHPNEPVPDRFKNSTEKLKKLLDDKMNGGN
ncbi:hypothetical protein [Lactiplantibacillus paraxiangfangensis]|uniref:hypothetical protein n=1 Tax=Lactiplantibacillus paraxiangfangensis TaxID=3076224 RepID=UPI0030C72E31